MSVLQAEIAKIDILALAGQDTTLKRKASTNGGEFSGPCPFCGGRDRFQVWPKHPDGKGRFYCRGCERSGDAVDYKRIRDELSSNGEALAALGIETKSNGNGHASKNGKDKSGQVVSRVHPYHDADGTILYEVVRFDNPKEYKPRDPGDPKFRPGVFDRHPRVLYRLPDVLEAVRSGDTVLIVEGEKTAEALRDTGFIATTIPGGANGPWAAGFSETLTGADVVILADQDRPGRQYAQRAACELYGKARSIKIIDLPGLAYRDTHGEDAEDWRKRGGTVAQLNHLIAAVPEYAPGEVSADSHESVESVSPWRLTLASDVMMRAAVRYLLGRKLPEAGIAALVGAPASGKSFMALDWALEIARSRNVVYCASEGSFQDRLLAWSKHHHEQPGKLAFFEGLLSLQDVEQVNQFINLVMPAQPALIVFDTLAWVMAGDENSAKDMQAAMGACRRIQQTTGAAILLVHHTNKAGTGYRGSSALLGAVDCMMEISNDDGLIRLSCEKSKDARPFEPEYYRMLEIETRQIEGERVSSCVLVPSDQVLWTKDTPLSGQQRSVLEVLALETFVEAGCRSKQLADYLTKISASSMYRVLSTLIKLCYVRQDAKGDPYYITDTGKQALLSLSKLSHESNKS